MSNSSRVGYVVSYDGKRGVGFIRAAEDDNYGDTTYEAKQLSKNYKERAEQEQLLMFRNEDVATEVPLIEGLKVRFRVAELDADEESLWRIASEVVPDSEDLAEVDDAGAPTAGSADPGSADEGAGADEASETAGGADSAWAVGKVAHGEMRDVGFAEEYEEGWDASSWDEDSRA